jgi:hypothetical protein
MIKQIEIDGEIIYLKKSLESWKIVHPIRNDISISIYDKVNKKINWDNIHWKNLICGGNWLNLVIIAIIISIVLGCLYEYSTAVNLLNKCLEKLPNNIKI